MRDNKTGGYSTTQDVRPVNTSRGVPNLSPRRLPGHHSQQRPPRNSSFSSFCFAFFSSLEGLAHHRPLAVSLLEVRAARQA